MQYRFIKVKNAVRSPISASAMYIRQDSPNLSPAASSVKTAPARKLPHRRGETGVVKILCSARTGFCVVPMLRNALYIMLFLPETGGTAPAGGLRRHQKGGDGSVKKHSKVVLYIRFIC